jgi:ribose 5-phosphate isomerase B
MSKKSKIVIASDHAGFNLKRELIKMLESEYSIDDLGPMSTDSVDYPDYADLVCRKLIEYQKNSVLAKAILICGSGQGMAMRANKFAEVRAALVYNNELCALSREHNDANVLCLGARFCSETQAYAWSKLFMDTPFAGGRHQTRVAKLSSSAQ